MVQHCMGVMDRNNIVFNGGHFDKQKIVQEIMFQSWTWIKEFDKSFSYSFVQWSMNPGLCLSKWPPLKTMLFLSITPMQCCTI